MAKGNSAKTANGSAWEFEAQLWAAADKMRGHRDASEYKRVCLDRNLGPRTADSFRQDLHPDLKADFILAIPPLNLSDWGGETLRADVRWKFGMPPANNVNYAWIQHFIHQLSPVDVAGIVLANCSMST